MENIENQYTEGLVSLVMPSYNHAKYIGQTFESLLNQTYDNIELIILDDGSTDNTKEIISFYEDRLIDRFKRVVIIFKENEGVCRTINKGLTISKGEFYYLIASDDILMPTFIEEHVSFLNKNIQFACSYSDGYQIDSRALDNKEYEKGILFSKDIKFFSGDYRNYILENTNLIKFPTIAFVYRKGILNTLGMYDETLMFEEADLFIRISRNYQIGAINKPLCFHRLHNNNNGRDIKKMAVAMQQLHEKYSKDELYSEIEKKQLLEMLSMFFEWEIKGEILANKKYLDWAKKKKIIVWGASGGGKDFLNKNKNLDIAFFVDSDPLKVEFQGFEVKRPDVLKGNSDKYYVITSIAARYYLDVNEILRSYGYKFKINFC